MMKNITTINVEIQKYHENKACTQSEKSPVPKLISIKGNDHEATLSMDKNGEPLLYVEKYPSDLDEEHIFIINTDENGRVHPKPVSGSIADFIDHGNLLSQSTIGKLTHENFVEKADHLLKLFSKIAVSKAHNARTPQ